MSDSPRMLSSKFTPRPLGPYPLERVRLLEVLQQHAEAKLVLMHAPAGYGKSTLMAQWNQRLCAPAGTGPSTGWISIDEDDNDAGRFAAVLGQALLPDAGAGTDLLDCMTGCLRPHGRFTLFLDEEEHLTADDALRLLEVLLELSPAGLHLVVGSRAQPRRLATQLSLRSDFLELTAQDLAFRPDEIGQFVQLRCGVTLDASTRARLAQRTEGWAAALQLAAVELARGEPPQAVCDRLTAPHSSLLRYLSEEILIHLQPRQRQFLLQTSFLLELSGPLCDAVTGGNDGEALLMQLQQANLLLQPVDVQRRRYRYHALFRDVLLQELHARHAEQLPILARRASDWSAQAQRPEDAVEYALLAGDAAHLIGCIGRCMESLISQAQFETAKRWLRGVPRDELAARPELLLWLAWVDLWSNDFGAARAAVSELERLSARQSIATEQQLGQHVIRVLLDILDGRYDQALAITASASRQAAAPERRLSVRLCNLRGLLAQMQGRFGEAAAQAEQAAVLAAQPPPMWLSLVHAAHIRGMVEMSLGNLSSAWREFHRPERALAATQSQAALEINPSRLLALLCGSKALVLYERNRLEDAEDCLERHGPFMNTVFSPTGRMLWYQLRARLRALQGDDEGCLASLEEGSAYAIRHGIAWMQRLMQWGRIDYDVARGDLSHARSMAAGLLEQTPLAEAPEWIVSCEELFGAAITSSRLLIHIGQARQALEGLRAHIAHSERQFRRLRLTKLLVLEALALQSLGERPRALAALRRALELGQRSGVVRTFVDEGAICHELLRELARTLPGGGLYVGRLLAAFEGSEPQEATARGAPAAVTAAPNPEPLSAREQQILQCLARGHSNLAVGQQLCLSPNTVKWHLRQMYGKLGVRSRTQAVHVALQQRWVRPP